MDIKTRFIVRRAEATKENANSTRGSALIRLDVFFKNTWHRIGDFSLAEMRLLLGSEDSNYQSLVSKVRKPSERDINATTKIEAEYSFENKIVPWMKKFPNVRSEVVRTQINS